MNAQTESELAINQAEQIYRAIDAAEARISCGADITEAFTWLKQEYTDLLKNPSLITYDD